jgi:uncharacterized protein YdeI (YjbR/CyaY-like superfamily)
MTTDPVPIFYVTADEWRQWLAEHHTKWQEVWVGFYKKGTGRASMTYPEAVDQALCFGWIDGVRSSVDADSYMNRFSPRKPTSNWSAVNIRRVGELMAAGLMHQAGLAAFEARKPEHSESHSFEQRQGVTLDRSYQEQLRANHAAWEDFQGRPPWYRRTATWWIMSAKQEATRQRRLATLIECSTQGRVIPPLER